MTLVCTAVEPPAPTPSRRLRRLVAAVAVPTALAGSMLVNTPAARADVAGSTGTFTATQWEKWHVPAHVYSITITAVGGSGADGSRGTAGPGGAGGRGAVVTETIPVEPFTPLYLAPGSAASVDQNGRNDDYVGGSGGLGGLGDGPTGIGSAGSGGGGGAGSVVEVVQTGQVLAVAGGGGGGGGGGLVASATGGTGGVGAASGAAGTGDGAGAGGQGLQPVTTPPGLGQDGSSAPSGSEGGGGGGGGGGFDTAGNGGGVAGAAAGQGGGGGGGAGGASLAIDPDAAVGVADAPGNGRVTVTWTTGLPITSTLVAPTTVVEGQYLTIGDVLTPAAFGGPDVTGTVDFWVVTSSGIWSTFASIPVTGGQASVTTTLNVTGRFQILAIYSGDSDWRPSTTATTEVTVVAPVTGLAVSPSPIAFGAVPVGSTATKTVTLRNTGTVAWSYTGASASLPSVSLTTTSCTTVAPGASCTAAVAFQPTAAGPVSATLTLAGGGVVVPVTGSGILAKPAVTHLSPTSGPRTGGTLVTVTGRNLTGVTAIKVGGVAATSVHCTSSTTCTAVTPRGTVGKKDIRVTTAAGTSAVVAADKYTYR